MKTFRILLLCLAFTFAAELSNAQSKDEPACKDSQLVGRFPGSFISACSDKAFDGYDFTIAVNKQEKTKRIEGKYLQLTYSWPRDTASKSQVVRNLNNTLKAAGYTFDYDSGEFGDFTVHKGKTWIMEEVSGGGLYRETIVVEK